MIHSMIKVFDSKAFDYKANKLKDMPGETIKPAVCTLAEGINTLWNLHLEIPFSVDSNRLIKEDVLIGIDYNPRENAPDADAFADMQVFRVLKCEKTEFLITCEAYPIFYDSRYTRVSQVKYENRSGKDVLKNVVESPVRIYGTKNYTSSNLKAWSDIDTIASTEWSYITNFDALFGDSDTSFVNVWNAEIIFNNFEIRAYKSLDTKAEKNRLRVQTGINMTGIKYTVDISNTYKYVLPKGYGDRDGNAFGNRLAKKIDDVWYQDVVKTPNDFPYTLNNVYEAEYSDIKLKEDASTSEDVGVTVCDTREQFYEELRKRALKEFTENHIDLPTITYDIDLIDISNLPEYEDVRKLVTLNLGDSVDIYNEDLGIETTARVIERTVDFTKGLVTNIKLGDYQENFFKNSAKTQRTVSNVTDSRTNTIRGKAITGVVDGFNSQNVASKTTANQGDVQSIKVENKTNDGTWGAMALGTKGLEVTRKQVGSEWDWSNSVILDFIGQFYGGIESTKNAHWKMGNVEVVINDGNIYAKYGDNEVIINGNGVFVQNSTSRYVSVTESTVVMNNGGEQLRLDGAGLVSIHGGSGARGLNGTYKVDESISVVNGVVTGVT
jgi:phage minor structural protein